MIDTEDLEKYNALEVYFTMKTWGKNCLETISFNSIKKKKVAVIVTRHKTGSLI